MLRGRGRQRGDCWDAEGFRSPAVPPDSFRVSRAFLVGEGVDWRQGGGGDGYFALLALGRKKQRVDGEYMHWGLDDEEAGRGGRKHVVHDDLELARRVEGGS